MVPHIAVFSGPTATIQNSPPLVTSDKAREKYGLPARQLPQGGRPPQDIVRMQRLAVPATLYIEAFSGHPLERDAPHLYAPPDGYVDASGQFSPERRRPDDVPVHVVSIGPEDGLFALPYMARRVDGAAWDSEPLAMPEAPDEVRQTYYPDASRIFEEIDRFGLNDNGENNLLASRATYDFYRAAPSGGYLRGLPAEERPDGGTDDIAPEVRGRDFFTYRPRHLAHMPAMPVLATITNIVQSLVDSGNYDGALWLEGSTTVEETAYWLNILLDTPVPIACTAAQRPHGAVGNDGDRNIIDCVDYIRSRIWQDDEGANQLGVVVVQDEQIFAARDVQKGDARPGGFVTTGGHGGVLGTIGAPGPPMLTFRPAKAHTFRSTVNLHQLPPEAMGVAFVDGRVRPVPVPVKDDSGALRGDAIPKVSIVKYVHFGKDAAASADMVVEVTARIDHNLRHAPLAGFVLEANAPFGRSDEADMSALLRAIAHGMPVVRTARGNAEGMVPSVPGDVFVAGNNLTAVKARLLLMACLLRYGCLPPARDPENPTAAEWQAIRDHIGAYQRVFDSH